MLGPLIISGSRDFVLPHPAIKICICVCVCVCVCVCARVCFKDFIDNMLHYRVILHVLVFLYCTTSLANKNSYLPWVGITV